MIATSDRLEQYDRLPPFDSAAETCVIGAMCLCHDDRATFRAIRRLLWPSAFYDDANQVMFKVLCAADDAGKPVDSVLLRHDLEVAGKLEEIGGAIMIGKVMYSVPSAVHGPYYAAIVADHARAREGIAIGNELVRRLLEPKKLEATVAEIVQTAVNRLGAVALEGREVSVWSIGEAIDGFIQAREKGGNAVALEVGVSDLDRDYRGLFRFGGYTLVAARPSMGKSTFLRWLLTGLAMQGTPCGLIAIEEDRDKIAGNVISSLSDIENDHIAYGKWTAEQRGRIGASARDVASAPLYGVDTAFSLSDVLAAAEILIGEHGCKVIAVDHLHLIDGVRAETRQEEISKISGALKNLWKRRNVVGVVAAQLNRPEKGQCPPPPHLTDLRGSGALEEHADAVLMLHRADYYYRGQDQYTPNGLAQFLIRKNRNGGVGEIVLKAELQFQRFAETVNGHEFD